MCYARRRKLLWTLFLMGLVGIALSAVVANATTLARLHFEELAQQSTAVARLRCLGSESLWEQGEIWTETRFAVLERNKGTLPEVVTVRGMGGVHGGLRAHVDGVPVFRAGEEVYLFLWNRAGEPYRVLGWTQGTFRIARDSVSGVEIVTQDSARASIFDPKTRAFWREGIRNLPVALFQVKLRKALQRMN